MRLLAIVGVALVLSGAGSAEGSAPAVSSWVGTYRLPASADPVAISVQLGVRNASVALGPGHAGSTRVAVTRSENRIRFTLPGLPTGVVFAGRLGQGALSGPVSQGSLHGTFRLSRGSDAVLPLLGLYRAASGSAVAVVQAEGFPAWLVELPSGRVHGIGANMTVGELLGEAAGNGAIRPETDGLAWRGVRYRRVALRQREVHVGATAATLTLPTGHGPFPAVAMVHGSGPQKRGEFQVFTAYCALLGIAVLADDKRGVGQSGGTYPGEAATESTVDVLADDAEREVRFLATLPQVDPRRVGLLGDSQAGWIIARAAAREKVVRWAVALVGPTVTQLESDVWGRLAGQSEAPPSASRTKMLGQVRSAGRGGFDPEPSLRRLEIPVLWLYGDDDRNVPTELCVERLERLRAGHDFTWKVLHMTHALLRLPSGLYSSLERSPGFAEGLYPDVGAWLRSRAILT